MPGLTNKCRCQILEIILINCTFQGAAGCMFVLFTSGAYVNSSDSFGRAPLFLAAERGQCLCVSQLVAHGANIDATEIEGRSVGVEIITDLGGLSS